MYINPKIAITNGWIKGSIQDSHIQPNAIDFTIDRLFDINPYDVFMISESDKMMRSTAELAPVAELVTNDLRLQGKEFWKLYKDRVYDGMSNLYVELPEGVAAQLIVRSTFNRNGVFITSGLYDSGFKGHIGFAIHNRGGITLLAPGTRIGQIIFIESDSAGKYSGNWNHDQDTHYSEKS